MLTLYGATGYTGQLIAAELASRGATFTLAGRSLERVERLREALVATSAASIEVAVASSEDPRALRALAERSRAVLSCAGPFERLGAPVVDACLDAGAHYLDITGELAFMLETAARDRAARERRVALVNGVGLDVVPSDLAAYLASAALGGAVDAIDLGLTMRAMTPSGGTIRSALGVLGRGSFAYVSGRYVEEALGRERRSFVFPGEFGERTCFGGPFGDLATIPRTTGAVHARTFLAMSVVAGTSLRAVAPLAHALGRASGALAARLAGDAGARARAMLPGSEAAFLRHLTASGEGPSAERRGQHRFALVAEARKNGRVARVGLSGADGYGLTAHTAAHAALALADPAYDRAGALSPMQAVPPASWRSLLEGRGCRVETLD